MSLPRVECRYRNKYNAHTTMVLTSSLRLMQLFVKKKDQKVLKGAEDATAPSSWKPCTPSGTGAPLGSPAH